MVPNARSLGITSWLAALLWLVSACTQNIAGPGDDQGDLPPPAEGVGDEEWSSRDITCSDSSDCAQEETCIDNVCQLQRCGDSSYESVAPLGERMALAPDLEIVAADSEPDEGAYFLDAYEASAGGLEYATGSSWNFGSREVVAMAGGDLYSESPDRVAVALEGEEAIHVSRAGGDDEIDLDMQPIALTAGDAYGDGPEEIGAISSDGRFALCRAGEEECESLGFDGVVEGVDITSADIDGDGFAEMILLTLHDGDPRITVWNPHHEATGEDEFLPLSTDAEYKALAAGDLSGNGIAEVVGLADAAWYNPFGNDGITVYRYERGELEQVGEASTGTRNTVDLTIGDLDMSGEQELAILHDERSVRVFRQSGDGAEIAELYEDELRGTVEATGIASADIQGTSPRIERTTGPELIPGDIVPVLAANFPPYDEARSAGDGGETGVGTGDTSYLFLGDSESTSETYADSVYTRWAVQAGFGFEIEKFGVGLGGSISGRFQQQVEYTESVTERQVLGNRFHVTPDTYSHGHEYGIVVLTAGCFHGYEYEVRDPSGRFESDLDGSSATGIVPVDGQVTLWSTPRYNALAEELDYLPTIEINTVIGNPDSYPREPQKLDGTPVPPEKMVFEDPPEYFVSDSGTVGWWLSEGEAEAQEEAMSTEYGVIAEGKLGPVKASGEHHWGVGEAHETSVGSEVLFGGGVPPIPDNPNTPENEYEEFAFPFSPYVYRKDYIDPDGDEAALYMLNFTVGER